MKEKNLEFDTKEKLFEDRTELQKPNKRIGFSRKPKKISEEESIEKINKPKSPIADIFKRELAFLRNVLSTKAGRKVRRIWANKTCKRALLGLLTFVITYVIHKGRAHASIITGSGNSAMIPLNKVNNNIVPFTREEAAELAKKIENGWLPRSGPNPAEWSMVQQNHISEIIQKQTGELSLKGVKATANHFASIEAIKAVNKFRAGRLEQLIAITGGAKIISYQLDHTRLKKMGENMRLIGQKARKLFVRNRKFILYGGIVALLMFHHFIMGGIIYDLRNELEFVNKQIEYQKDFNLEYIKRVVDSIAKLGLRGKLELENLFEGHKLIMDYLAATETRENAEFLVRAQKLLEQVIDAIKRSEVEISYYMKHNRFPSTK